MMTGEVLPSSNVTFLIPATDRICRPTGGLPVNVILATRGSVINHSPTLPPEPTTRFSAPAGRPASASTSHNLTAVSGVVLAGLSTSELPAASAGATLCATKFKGKLNGLMAAITPTGRRVQKPK